MAVHVLGAWKARTCWINMGGRFRIYPPASVMLISQNPGLGKGIAIQQAKRVLRTVGYTFIAPDRVSSSMLLGIMSNNSQMNLMEPSQIAVLASELAGFFREGDVMTGGLLIDLADLMDMPDTFVYATRRHGTEEINLPTFQIAGCSNMDWLVDHMPRNAFTGGWFPRQYVSVMSREDVSGLDDNYPAPHGLLERMIGELKVTREIRGPVKVERKVLKMFINHRKQSVERAGMHEDDRRAAYLDRLPTNTMRLAMLLAVSEGKKGADSWGVRWHHYRTARRLMEWFEETHDAMYEKIGLSLFGRWRVAMEGIVLKSGEVGISRTELKRRMKPHGINMSQFDAVVDDLMDSHVLGSGTPRVEDGKPVQWYVSREHARKEEDREGKGSGKVVPLSSRVTTLNVEK